MGVAFSYDVSPRVTARLNFTNLLDICGQRGYAWDNPVRLRLRLAADELPLSLGQLLSELRLIAAASAAAVSLRFLVQRQQHGFLGGSRNRCK